MTFGGSATRKVDDFGAAQAASDRQRSGKYSERERPMAVRYNIAFALIFVLLAGCGESKPDKAVVEKKIRDGLGKSPEWKDIAFEMKLKGTLTTAGANRAIDGKTCWFSFTGSKGHGGVAVRGPSGDWLCKYSYENGNETGAEKMTGSDDDIARFRNVAQEFADVCVAASQ
jgi:hypothetical protein